MESKNPVLKHVVMDSEGEVERSNVCTTFGVFGKTLLLLGIAIVAALVPSLLLKNPTDEKLSLLVSMLAISLILGLVSCIIASVSVNLCPVFSIIYSVCEGVCLGAVSALFDMVYPGIAFLAVIITLAITTVMAVLYFTGIVKANGKIMGFVLTVLFGFMLMSLIAFICQLCGVTYVSELFFGNTAIGWIVTILLVLVGALSLVIDFDYAAQVVRGNCDKKYEWTAAFGLAVSVIYLYLRVLELLAKIKSNK